MDYAATLDYVNSFINFEQIPRYSYASSFKLERMHAFLQELGNPHEGLNVIHIAGSKGKGSTCAIISYILKEAGYRVGLYTSPHLLDIRERIRVLTEDQRPTGGRLGEFGGTIEKDEFIELVQEIKVVAEKFRDHKVLGRLSFFEFLTACAFLYFKKKKVSFVILETGLGGRLDATNVTMPVACGITNISFEHTDKLGCSLESIAREKAGIIKVESSQLTVHSLVVVTASQQKEALDVIRNVCRERKANLYEIGKDVNYSILSSDTKRQIFNLELPGFSYKALQLNLLGAHQVENAALAIAIVKFIDNNRLRIDEGIIKSGLKNASWPGRLQIVQKDPYVILDGAQNVASIEALLKSIKDTFYYKRLICIFGISSDKDIKGVSSKLDKLSDIVILTKARTSRAKEPFYLKDNFYRSRLELINSVEEALKLGLEIVNKEDLILVTGSLYVVGEAMSFLKAVSIPN